MVKTFMFAVSSPVENKQVSKQLSLCAKRNDADSGSVLFITHTYNIIAKLMATVLYSIRTWYMHIIK